MTKLRKMWIDMEAKVIVDLMNLMKTQSVTTLATFALEYARKNYLPLYLQNQEDSQLVETFPLIENWINHPKEKVDLKELRKKAATMKDQNIQIQYRSIITAFAVMSTPTNALGFLLYGCMAISYQSTGLSQEEYDQLALLSLQDAYLFLQSMAIPNELHPAKLNFNC